MAKGNGSIRSVYELDLEAQVSHALQVSINELLAVLLAILENALIASLLCLGAGTARLERFAVRTDRQLTGMCRSSLDRFGH